MALELKDVAISLNHAPLIAPFTLAVAAGGIVTDWQGRPAFNGGQILAAANREVHAEAMALLNG